MDVSALPEAPDEYRSMVRLRSINVSGNERLEGIPWSWSRVPNLAYLDISHCERLVNFPVQLCMNSTSLESIRAVNTSLLRSLSWSGQLRAMKSRLSSYSMSQACNNGFKSFVVELDLSHNNLTGSDIVKDMRWILDWHELRYLDLSFNDITSIDNELFKFLLSIESESMKTLTGGVNYTGNPIKSLHFTAEEATNVLGVFARLSERCNHFPIESITMRYIHGSIVSDTNIFRCFSETLRDMTIVHTSLRATKGEKIFLYSNELEELTLEDTDIPLISGAMFAGLKSLTLLQIMSSNGVYETKKIKLIEAGAFSHLTSLQNLKLSIPHLEAVEEGSFAGLLQLQRLQLSMMKNETAVNGILAELRSVPKLGYLNIMFNFPTNITSTTFAPLSDLQSFTQLRISFGDLETNVFFFDRSFVD